MIYVQVKDNTQEAFDKALQIFKKKSQRDGFIQEIKERRYYKKPSEIRHFKDQEIKRELERKRNKGKKK